MNDSSSNLLNESDLDYSSKSNQVNQFILRSRCVVDEQFVLKVGMTFKTLEERREMEFKISPTLKTNLSAGINCSARIYVHILTDVGLWIISKVVLNHSHPCCPDRVDMLNNTGS
ncbi:hypothetical protein Ahy_A05g022319 isoform B [Arachis hypogaea]|uniref:FAR1 domain-containing protein n=1 Tax=Arachis hypogaea TaxID=3818 RepID=A0A445D0B1_ARAHY|nr:hypothetical protein Ahy_A05g022319 isoform B [Arachis hypogaea]